MEPNEPLNAAPQPDAAPVTTQSPAATQERPAEKPRAAVRVTQQFVVRMQRGQNEAALPPKGGKPPLRATYNAVGQLLYRVGTQAEYTCIRLGRGIRGAFRLALRNKRGEDMTSSGMFELQGQAILVGELCIN